MTVHAAGSYIRTLREARQLSRDEIAAAAGTSASQVERIENGKQETRSSVLFGLVRAVRGNAEHVQHLLLDEAAGAAAGVTRAQALLQEERQARHRLSPEQHIAAFGKTKLFGRMLPTTAAELSAFAALSAPYKPADHLYEGWRDAPTTVRVLVDGRALQEAVETPAAMYEWGYGGTGPALLAQAILWCEYGRDVSQRYGPRFATDVIATLPREVGGLEWVLDSAEIALWFTLVRLLEQVRGAPGNQD